MRLLAGIVFVCAALTGLVIAVIWVLHWLARRPAGGRHAAAEAEADTFVAELRGLPAPGLDYISDRSVRLPRTPPVDGFVAGALWQPPAYALAAVDKTWPPCGCPPGFTCSKCHPPEDDLARLAEAIVKSGQRTERLATDTDVRTWEEDNRPPPATAEQCWCGQGPRGHLPAYVVEALHHDTTEATVNADSMIIPAVAGA